MIIGTWPMVVSSHEKPDCALLDCSILHGLSRRCASHCVEERERERQLGGARRTFFFLLFSPPCNEDLHRQLDGRCRRSDFHNAPCTLPHSRSLTPSHPPAASCARLRRPSNATRTPRRRPSPRPFHRTTSERESATDDHRETFAIEAERRGARSPELPPREEMGGDPYIAKLIRRLPWPPLDPVYALLENIGLGLYLWLYLFFFFFFFWKWSSRFWD